MPVASPPCRSSQGIGFLRRLTRLVAVPVGVDPAGCPRQVSAELADNSTVIAFTDDLAEREGEYLEAGLERLRAAAPRRVATIEAISHRLAASLICRGSLDVVAILGVRWRS